MVCQPAGGGPPTFALVPHAAPVQHESRQIAFGLALTSRQCRLYRKLALGAER